MYGADSIGWWSRAILLFCLAGASTAVAQPENEQPPPLTVSHPGLACSALLHARSGKLPEGILLRTGDIEISEKDLKENMAKAWQGLRIQLQAYPFFALEQEAARKILLLLAKPDAKAPPLEEQEAIAAYFEKVIPKPDVTDQEVADSYENIRDLIGLPLEQVRSQVHWQIVQEKQQAAMDEHIRTLGRKMDIVIAEEWVSEQAKRIKQNPVDMAKAEGKPLLVTFGSAGCCGPDQTLSLLREAELHYKGKIRILHLDAREEQVLGARLGITGIPFFLYYDKSGNEAFRHTGVMTLDKLTDKINDQEE